MTLLGTKNLHILGIEQQLDRFDLAGVMEEALGIEKQFLYL
jgi:hypothetical protein